MIGRLHWRSVVEHAVPAAHNCLLIHLIRETKSRRKLSVLRRGLLPVTGRHELHRTYEVGESWHLAGDWRSCAEIVEGHAIVALRPHSVYVISYAVFCLEKKSTRLTS